jgi:phospholipase C
VTGIDIDVLRQRIEHVVVVMLENRSFDHMLGYLNHSSAEYERLTPTHEFSNFENPLDPNSRRWPATPDGRPHTPLDPGHSHETVMLQLGLTGNGAAPNSGFVASYLDKAGAAMVIQARKAGVELGAVVMGCLDEASSPGITRLAKEFAICRRWFSSVPGETWPNRNFAHAATSDYTVNIELGLYTDPTIFELLEKASGGADGRRAWRVYHDGPAQVMAFRNLWDDDHIGNFADLDDFQEHVAEGKLARYSFIEPNHNTPGARLLHPFSSSQHPNNNIVPFERYFTDNWRDSADFRRGDALVCAVYEALRRKPEVFEKTLLLITYDEHGGWYDHVPPPEGIPPGDRLDRGFLRSLIGRFIRRGPHAFDFRRLGARVPTIAVSPWISRGTLDDTRYDHASIPHTVRELFCPGASPLSARDAGVASFAHLAGALDRPRRGDELPSFDYLQRFFTPPAGLFDVAPDIAAREAPPDDYQRSLDTLTIIVCDNLDRSEEDLVNDPVLPMGLVDTSRPGPSSAEQAAEAMERFRERARQHR